MARGGVPVRNWSRPRGMCGPGRGAGGSRCPSACDQGGEFSAGGVEDAQAGDQVDALDGRFPGAQVAPPPDHFFERHRPFRTFGIRLVGQPIEPGLLRLLSKPPQDLVLLGIDHYGFLLAAPSDDRRGLVPTSAIDDVRQVAADLGHGLNHRVSQSQKWQMYIRGPRPPHPGQKPLPAGRGGRHVRQAEQCAHRPPSRCGRTPTRSASSRTTGQAPFPSEARRCAIDARSRCSAKSMRRAN
jgi:hypothetical protein